MQRLASYWAEVFGGPARYSQSCGGQPAMLAMHSGTGAEGDIGDPVMSLSPIGSEPPSQAPVPRWSWDGLQEAGAA